jgi:hypothetical protein
MIIPRIGSFVITYNYTNNGNIISELYNCEILINIHKRLKIRVKLYVAKLIQLKQFKVKIYLFTGFYNYNLHC